MLATSLAKRTRLRCAAATISTTHSMIAPVTDQTCTARARAFLRDGFSDYVAARVLLLARLPLQGALSSSCAIEKCIKALLALRGEKVKWKHLNTEHWDALLAHDPNAEAFFDRDFVELNQRVYKMRYTADVPPDFSLVVASREFLAELDQMVSVIVSCFKIDENGRRQKTFFEQAADANDVRVLEENHMIAGPRKDLFIPLRPQFVYEVRRRPGHGLIEATYSTTEPAKTCGFLRPGLIPGGENDNAVEFSHWPIQSADGAAIDLTVSFSG